MRTVRSIAIVLGLILFASLAGAAEQVNVATPVQGLVELPIVAAMRNRYFAAEGLEIQKIQIKPDIAVKALVGGEVDFNLTWGASVRAAISGTPVKLVAVVAARPSHILIARREIRSGKDLKGKILGVDRILSETDYLSRIALRFLGVEPEREVNIVEIGDGALLVDELRAGSIHAAVVDGATAARVEEEGFKRLVPTGDIIDLPVLGIAVTARKLSSDRAQVSRFIRATLRGGRFIKQNHVETVRIIQRYLNMTPPQAAKAYDATVGVFADDGLISDRALALSVQQAREGRGFAGEPVLSQVADWSVLREILAERRKTPWWLRPYDP